MTENEIFNRALNIGKGWEVYHVEFKGEQKEIQIHMRKVKRNLHTCANCGKPNCRIVDHGKEREWRHMNFLLLRYI